MYARTVGSRELTFGVSGMLWRENLVMYDRQTDSWWAQAMGEAIHGELKGTSLEIFPSQMMTWKEWRARHPDTLVLQKPSGNRAMRDSYATYHASDRIGVTGFTRQRAAVSIRRHWLPRSAQKPQRLRWSLTA